MTGCGLSLIGLEDGLVGPLGGVIGGQALSVRVDGPLAFNEPELMLGVALDGLGVAYLLDYELAPHVASGRLVRLLADWTPPFLAFMSTTRPGGRCVPC